MKKRPSTGQIKYVPFLRKNASFGLSKSGSIIIVSVLKLSVQCIVKVFMKVVLGLVVLVEVVVVSVVVMVEVVVVNMFVVMVGKRGTTIINFNNLVVVVIAVLRVSILIVLELLYLNVFLLGFVVVLVVVEGL